MSGTMSSGAHGGAGGPDELRRQIARTRAELGDTVEALAAKADVRARAREQVAGLRAKVGARTERLRGVTSHGPRRTRRRELSATAADSGVPVALAGEDGTDVSPSAVRSPSGAGHDAPGPVHTPPVPARARRVSRPVVVAGAAAALAAAGAGEAVRRRRR
jgi:hypothetical protein